MKLSDYIKIFSEMEREAYNIYEKIKAKSEEKIAAVASKFANEELAHENLLNTLCKEIIDSEIDDSLMHTSELNINPLKTDEIDLILKSQKDFFLYALQGEKKSILMYNEFKKNFEVTSTEYKLFNRLVDGEKEHMHYILKTLHELS